MKTILVLAGNRSEKLLKPLGCQKEYQVLYISTEQGIFTKLKWLAIHQMKYAGILTVIVDYPGYFSLITLLASKICSNKFALRFRGDIWREIDRLPYIHRKIKNSIVNYIMKMSDIILPVSESLLRITKGKVDTPVVFIPIPANLLVVDHAEKISSGLESKLIFVTVANFGFPGKAEGLKEFLPIFDACRNYGIEAEWYVVGDGEHRGYLENTLADWPHSCEHIHFLGHVNNPGNILARANAVVYFSREDATSNSVLEAMLLRKLLVVNEYEPLMEYVKDKETGIVLDASNVKESAERLLGVISEPEYVKELQSAAYSWVLEHYNEKVIGEKLIDALREISP